jgi:uncharacterized Zn finger protein (UPF0148 family)
MEAIHCKECGKPIEQKHAGRPRQFCSISCRSNFWQKEKRKEAELYRASKAADTSEQKEVKEEAPTINLTTKSPEIKPYDAFYADILNTTYSGDLQKVMKEVDSHPDLGAVNRAKLRALADHHRTTFTN